MMSYMHIVEKMFYTPTLTDLNIYHMMSFVCAHDTLTHACVARGGEGWKVGGDYFKFTAPTLYQ